MNIQECIEKGFLAKVKFDPKLIEKELNESENDLNRAVFDFENGDYKWSIIKGYYSMFHAGKAVLFALGYKERKHVAVQIVLENLCREGKLESIYTEFLSSAAEDREGADYRYKYTKEISKEILDNAEIFLKGMKELVKRLLK